MINGYKEMVMEEVHDAGRIKVLYIDDDSDLITIYVRFFEKSDYDLSTASNAEEGLSLARDLVPDLIISDVVLPGMNGIELCRMIRKERHLQDTIFMLVTGIEVDSGDIVEGFRAGADEYLMKPFSRDELFVRIDALLRIQRLKDGGNVLKREITALRGDRDRLRGELEDSRSFLAKEKEILNSSLKQMAMMVEERDKGVKEILRLEQCLKNDHKALVDLLAQAIESKPQYHRGHSSSVAEIASVISKMMDLPDDEIEDIISAARLHELGKLCIPEELAMKSPTLYSQAEQDLLVLHPLKGSGMLKMFNGCERISRIIRHIHEHVNGQGFPDGLKKDAIPMGSRIIAAVNVFDNLVYRGETMTADKALEMIDSHTGSVIDAGVMVCLRRYVSRNSGDTQGKTIEVRLYEVKPGMTLAAGLYTTKGAKLLHENTVLTQDTINQIARYNKIDLLEETVFIKG